uniref:Secreted protein n=1 Tax=Arundo donax TaxID=35708 RepID=A0A0A9GVK9_ARUDO
MSFLSNFFPFRVCLSVLSLSPTGGSLLHAMNNSDHLFATVTLRIGDVDAVTSNWRS